MNKTAIAILLIALLAVSVNLNITLYIQNQNEMQTNNNLVQQINTLNQNMGNLTKVWYSLSHNNSDFSLYYDEFGQAPLQGFSFPFAPPISMYRALIIALETDGWNKTSLSDKVVHTSLMYGSTGSNATRFGTGIFYQVTNPPLSYSNVQVENMTYRYMWEIIINNATTPFSHYPCDFSLVDASTGEIIPNPMFW